MKVAFKEVQRFNIWPLWILFFAMAIIPAIGIYKQIYLKQQFGNNPMSDTGLIVFAILMVMLPLLFMFMKLETSIDENGVKMRFFPFVKKDFAWSDIKSAKVVNYGFVGGWGIRLYTKYGTVYNTKGKMGLALELTNGKKYLIGTQKEIELRGIVDEISRSEYSKNSDV